MTDSTAPQLDPADFTLPGVWKTAFSAHYGRRHPVPVLLDPANVTGDSVPVYEPHRNRFTTLTDADLHVGDKEFISIALEAAIGDLTRWAAFAADPRFVERHGEQSGFADSLNRRLQIVFTLQGPPQSPYNMARILTTVALHELEY